MFEAEPPGESEAPPLLTEVRMVLLGNKASGKSSSANTILGRDDPRVATAECVRRRGVVGGTAVTVVEAPGWWRNYMLKDTPQLNIMEMELSFALCDPGPHAVLVLVRLDTQFTQTCKDVTEERLDRLGIQVWNHAMVLFTYGDWLQDTPIQEHIQNQGRPLQRLLTLCGNRHHVLNNQRGDLSQVQELLEKISRMVTRNQGGVFQIGPQLLNVIQEKKRTETKAEERMDELQTSRLRRPISGAQSEIRILIVGNRYSGKSSIGNTILGQKEFELRRTFKAVSKRARVAERSLTVVEAPGWWNNYSLSNTTRLTRQELFLSVSSCLPGPHVLLLALRVDGSFTERNREAIVEHLQIFGSGFWKHTMLLFTYGDWLGDTCIEKHIESEGTPLLWLIEKCNNRYHVFDNTLNDETQVQKLLLNMEHMMDDNKGEHMEVESELLEAQEQQVINESRAKLRRTEVQKQNESGRDPTGRTLPPVVRMVLIGSSGSGKSSAGITILGENAFDVSNNWTGQKHEGKVGNRAVALVEVHYGTMESLLYEVSHGVLNLPGPLAYLLVIQADTHFTAMDRTELQQQVSFINKWGWNHCMVLFTCGDWLGDRTIEEHIEGEGEHLQELLKLCGNRYHTLNHGTKTERAQVTELMEKIEKMLTEPKRGTRPDLSVSLTGNDQKPSSSREWNTSDPCIRMNHSMQHSYPKMGGEEQPDSGAEDSFSDYGFNAPSRFEPPQRALSSSESSGTGSLSNYSFQNIKNAVEKSRFCEDQPIKVSQEPRQKGDLQNETQDKTQTTSRSVLESQ